MDKPRDRAIVSYPGQTLFQLFIAYAHIKVKGRSAMSVEIFREHFNKMSQPERDRLLKIFKTLTPDQIKRPDSDGI